VEVKPRGPRPIDELIRNFLRNKGIRSGGGYSIVFKAWTEALEAGMRAHAQPVRFRSGELTVEVDSAVHLQEMKNFTGDDYRRKANEHLGKNTIRRVVFKLRG
jgi:hypothetical protein